MPKYKRLSDDDLSLAIDRAWVAIEGEKLIVAKLVAGVVGFQDDAGQGDDGMQSWVNS